MYRKIRFYYRLTQAFISKHFKSIFIGMLIAGLASYGLTKISVLLPYFRTTRKIAVVGRFTLTDLPLTVSQKVSLGLTSLDSSGLPSPGLAKSWEISSDGKIYTFNINTDLKWQDSVPVKSVDIKYQFRDAEISYPNDSQLVIKLADPFAPLPTLLSKPVFRIITSRFFSPQLVGTGSYEISSVHYNGRQVESIVLSPMEEGSRLPRLVYYFYPSTQAAKTAFKLGEVNEIENLTSLDELSGWKNVSVETIPAYDRFLAVFFNTQDPILSGQSGRNLRFALSYALPKDGYKYRAFGPISSRSWAFNPDLKTYEFDLNKAKDMVKKIEKKPEELTLTTVPSYIGQAQEIARNWEKLGIKVKIVVSQDIPASFQMLLVAQAISSDPDQYLLWHSTQDTTNLTHLNNPRIDKFLEDGRKTYSFEARKKLYFEFQKFLVEEAPAVFLYYPETYTVSKK